MSGRNSGELHLRVIFICITTGHPNQEVSLMLTRSARIASLLALVLCSPLQAQQPPLRILATVGMVADIARTVGGDCVAVDTLIGPGTDPHYYSATPSDVRRLAAAELILYVDFALEEQLARVLQGFSDRTPAIGVLDAALDREDLLDDPAESGAIDPHVWMDVARWARIAPVIADAVAAQRPACADPVAERLQTHEAELAALHAWVRDAVASIPEGQRMLVTAHDAFAYFADAYGMEASEGIEGISTASEASIADIRAVAGFVVENAVSAVFVESTVNPRTIRALVDEVRARGHDVAIGGELYSDSMGDEGTAAGTYIGMIHTNTVTVVKALGGTLPPLPEALANWAATWGIDPAFPGGN